MIRTLALAAGLSLFMIDSSFSAPIVADFGAGPLDEFITNYSQDGINFTATTGTMSILVSGIDNGIMSMNPNSTIVMTFDGGPFDFVSFDRPFTATLPTILGSNGDMFGPSSIGVGGTTFLDPLFRDVESVTFTVGATQGSFWVDDITINSSSSAPVSTPSTLPLIMAGIACIGIFAFHQNRRTA